MPPVPQVRGLQASLSAQVGILTRQINRFQKVQGMQHTSMSISQLQSFFKSAEVAMEKITNLTAELMSIDPDKAEEYDAKATEQSTRFDDLADELGKVMDASVAPLPAAVAAPPVVQNTLKVVEALRPEKLTLDFTPTEFHLWVGAFKSFYATSKLNTLPLLDQHAFLYACVNADLHKRIMPHVGQTTPVFSGNNAVTSLVGLLESVFLHRYPLVQRRLDFFQYAHVEGQSCSAWLAELRMKADIADLADLSTDQLIAFRAMTSIKDEELQDELLKLRNPTLKDVETEVLQYEAKLATKARTSSKVPVSVSVAEAKVNSKGRCRRCNRIGHFVKDCRLPGTVKCHACARMGHIAPACSNKLRAMEASTVAQFAEEKEDTENVASRRIFVAKITSKNLATPKITVSFSVGSLDFSSSVIPDTGATRTIVPYGLVQKYGLQLLATSERIVAANGERIDCSGSLLLTANFEEKFATIDALVSRDLHQDILLSWQDMKKLAIIPESFPHSINFINTVPEFLNTLFEDYTDVISESLGTRCLAGTPMKIHLRTDIPVKPFRIYTTRKIPLHQQVEADLAVQKALEEGVICREDGPTEWCCRGSFVPKPNGKLRLITDFIPLNKYIQHPVHPFPSALEIIQSIRPDSKVFAVLDCTMGYYQVPLGEESSKLTTFLLPQGRFRYKHAPMGLSASSDEFCRRSDAVIAGLDGIDKLVDDILVQAPNCDILYQRLNALFMKCRASGLTLNRRKAQFYVSPVDDPIKFAGFRISCRGVNPDPDKFAAIAEFPSPSSVTELRSFLGLANQFSPFLPDLAHVTNKLRLLLRKNTAFLWSTDLEQEFLEAKRLLTSSPLVLPFDPTLKTELWTDASRIGLGFILMQKTSDGRPRIIYCGSRSLVPAETRYAVVELECLAAIFALRKCDFYLRGLEDFTLVTDHRPLVGVFEKSPQDVQNPRLQRLREKAAPYKFGVVWIAGKENAIADALSRKPFFPAEKSDLLVASIICATDVDDVRLQQLRAAASCDKSYMDVMSALLGGKILTSLPTVHPARVFANVWSRLGVQHGLLILDGYRIVPPVSERATILKLLHASHAGIVKSRKLAQQMYFWPGLMNDLKMMIGQCSACQLLQPSQPAEPLIHTVASQAMEDVSVDPFSYGGHLYLVLADRYSGYLWVQELKKQDTLAVTSLLLSWFLEFGFPRSIRTDGGPQFRAEFDAFCARYGIRHDTSSPLHPDANGHAESGVKAAKYLLIKCLQGKENFREALMELQNTPREDGYSPAQMFFGRRQRTLLPCLSRHLEGVDQAGAHIAREQVAARKRKLANVHSREMIRLQVGQRVLLQNNDTKRWDSKGRVIHCNITGRSYYVRLDNGRLYWRNRKFLRSIAEAQPSEKTGRCSRNVEEGQRNLRPRRPVNYRQSRPYKTND